MYFWHKIGLQLFIAASCNQIQYNYHCYYHHHYQTQLLIHSTENQILIDFIAIENMVVYNNFEQTNR